MTRMERLYLKESAGRRKWRIRRLVLVAVAAMSLAAGPAAMAAIDDGPGNGNPAVNSTGKCPPGQNQDTSTGGLKKCEE